MARKLTTSQAIEIGKRRKIKAGGHHGGRYPSGHVSDDPGCYCNGCVRRKKIEAEAQRRKMAGAQAAIEVLRRPQILDARGVELQAGTVVRGKVGLERDDLDVTHDWGL